MALRNRELHARNDDDDASVSECTWTLSALEALRNALYKFKAYLLTYLLSWLQCTSWRSIDFIRLRNIVKALHDGAVLLFAYANHCHLFVYRERVLVGLGNGQTSLAIVLAAVSGLSAAGPPGRRVSQSFVPREKLHLARNLPVVAAYFATADWS